jgi:Flp pilus assembly protein TadD
MRLIGELAAVGIALAVFGYAGWDGALWDPRYQLGLHVAGMAAVGGMVWVGLAGGALPRSRLELPLLALLLAFALAGLSAWNVGLTAGALASIVGFALMLPVAALALRHRPTVTAVLVTGVIGALAVGALVVLASRRLDWVLAGAPGLPPIRLARESTVFGSVAVAPFALMAVVPLALLVAQRRVRFGMLGALALIGVPLTLLSGSRAAWLAAAVAVVVLAAPPAIRRLRSVPLDRRLVSAGWWTPRRIGLTFLGVVAAVLVLVFVAPRLTDLRSLVYRGYLWRDTVSAWSQDPWFGIGPGSMPWARQAAAPPLSFPVRQPHSHDIPLGILGDAGLIGLAAALVLFAAFVLLAGPWRTRTLPGRAAFAVLMGFAVGMLFEDLTFLPAFNLLVVLLAALALIDAGAVRWEPPSRLPLRWALAPAVGAVALLAVVGMGDASAVAYRHGTDAAGEERWPDAYAALERARALNPWQPTGPKALTVAADRAGLPAAARTAAARAVQLNPGDGPSWTNLALLCAAEGDRQCARNAADRAVRAASAAGTELANAALIYQWLGDEAAADRSYRYSLLTNHWTGMTVPWPRPVSVGDGRASELGVDAAELGLLIARRLNDEPIVIDDYVGPVPRALAHAMRGDREGAAAEIERAKRLAPASATTWEVAALLARHYGDDPTPLIRIGDAVRGGTAGTARPRPAFLIFDIASFRAYPADGLVRAAERLLPDTPWPWVLEPLLAP